MSLDATTLATYIAEAEVALHNLALGQVVVTTSNTDGGSVTYNQASMPRLKAYLADLEAQLAVINGTQRRKPIGFEW